MTKALTHRCKELLQQNQNSWCGPVAVQYKKNLIEERECWQLFHLEIDDEDWDNKYMESACEIKYCPFCGEKLPTA